MREPAFWWRAAGWQSGLLSPLAVVYGAVAAGRMARPGGAAGILVLCVGNLTMGGAGKTPTAIALAQMLAAAGRRPFLLSRGYGGSLAGPVQVDTTRHTSAEVGDEPLLLVRTAPTIVAHDRVAGAEMARAAGADSIVMDDGFQNPALQKNFSLLVVDGRRGIGNGRVFPAGPLRAPLEAQIARAQALLVIGEGVGSQAMRAVARQSGIALFHGRLEPDARALAALRGRPALAFAGIGDPEKFFTTLRAAGIEVKAAVPFPDHHRYRNAEASDLMARAERDGLALVTTEKDLARMAGGSDAVALAAAVRALPVTLAVTGEDAFREFVLARLG